MKKIVKFEQSCRRTVEELTHTYTHRLRKSVICPACRNGRISKDKKTSTWNCEECGYKLSDAEFEDSNLFWFCEGCNTYLNNQEGFDRQTQKHICGSCGLENDIIREKAKGICFDCGRIIPDPDGGFCEKCWHNRCQKAKKAAQKVGKAIGFAVVTIGAICLASRSDVDGNSDYELVPDDDDDTYGMGPGVYPSCNFCGTEMTEFDGWAWYTCPICENKVRIIEGKEAWYDDLFAPGKKSHYSDYELADFCRGGELSED